MFRCELLHDKYLHLLEDSGGYWDLEIVKRDVPGEDEDGLAIRIGKVGEAIKQDKDGHGKPISARLPTLFVRKDQYNAFFVNHKKRLYAICHLMVVDKKQADWTYSPWDADGNDGLLWVNHGEVWSKWDGNALNYHYVQVNKGVVDAYGAGLPVPAPVIPPVNPGGPPVVIGVGKYKITAIVTVEEVE